MKTTVLAVASACTLLTINLAQAQSLFSPSWYANTMLTHKDWKIIRDTVRREIHGQQPGKAANWRNPGTGHSGKVALLSNSMRQGMPCEQIDYRIASSRPGEHPEHYVFNSCRLPDGTWKLAD
jgi:17 kDa outer membrane surface antigen